MGISKVYLITFSLIIAIIGLAILTTATAVYIYPITRPIPAWYVYIAGGFIAITLIAFGILGISRSSTWKASHEGITGVLLIAVLYVALTALAGLWLSSWAADFFNANRHNYNPATLSRSAKALLSELEKDFGEVYKNDNCRLGGQETSRFDGRFSLVLCDHQFTTAALNGAATSPRPGTESGSGYSKCISSPRLDQVDAKGVVNRGETAPLVVGGSTIRYA
ncbi:hypothetical protein FOL47_011082 [Perkinsus chesapeaki]|uniref:Uncharacterized protein n=1 Tax=Perkinsus chesapeaki TaxID=330153 RepID=A0A7J6KZV6_PERCH|nr:hypothetical protein FOL47_011082 [Perkinsus chesapeaki]